MAATIGDIYQVDVNYTTPTGGQQNTFGFVCVTNVAGDAQANLATAFKTALVKATSGGLLYKMANTYSSASLLVEDVKPGTLATYELTYTAVVGGQGPSEVTPPQCAVVLSLRTALKGRSYHGRVYIPGILEGDQAGGQLTAGAVTDLSAIGTQLLTVFGPSGTNGDWRLAVISRQLNGVERITPVATQVTSISLDTTVRTQRRRVFGVGS